MRFIKASFIVQAVPQFYLRKIST